MVFSLNKDGLFSKKVQIAYCDTMLKGKKNLTGLKFSILGSLFSILETNLFFSFLMILIKSYLSPPTLVVIGL